MTQKSDAERLMGELFNFAQLMLEKHGEFHPFGGYLKESGDIVHVGIEDGEGMEKLFRLEKFFRGLSAIGEVVVFGAVSNVRLLIHGGEADAIKIFLEHRDGYCVDIFFRYELNRGVEIIETTAQQGSTRLFALSH